MSGEDKRLYLLLAASLTIVISGLLAWYLLQPKLEPVMQQASESQLALAIQELTNANIPYRISEDGTILMVREDYVAKTRSLIADLGLPFDQSIGLETFQNSDFGVTEFAQQINYKRALEGELVRTISSLKEVRYARVHLVLSEKGILQSKSVAATAAVTLFLREGAKLTYQQIQGIRQLVASSVPQLKEESVSILDQNGIALDTPDLEGSRGYSSVMRIKEDIEKTLELRIIELLEPEFGSDTVFPSVNVDLDLDEITRRKEELITDTAGKGKVLSSKTSKSYPDKKNGKTNENSELQYGYGRLIEEVIVKPGAIARISAAVSIKRDLNEETKNNIHELVRHAIGVSAQRGDSLFIHAFQNEAAQATESTQETMSSKDSDEGSPDELPVSDGSRRIKDKPSITGQMTNKTIQQWLLQYWSIGFGLLVLFSMMLIYVAKIRSARSLTDKQREELLGDIKQWLQS
jgi:flagellar M-ring protein FliF